MFEEPRGTTSYDAVMLRPASGSREATPSSDRETPSDITAHSTQEGGKKRHKQPLQGTTTDSNDGKAGDSGMRRTPTAARNDKHWERSPTNHFKRLLKEAYPNHTYPVRHKLKDCSMIRSFMTSGALTWGAKLNKGLDESNTTSFLEENAIMMVYGGCPPSGRRHVSSLSPRAPNSL
jgi:hypothetical protein